MTMTDPIADMLTRLRNASKAKHSEVTMPLSKMKAGIARILKQEGFIKEWEKAGDAGRGTLRIFLKYSQDGEEVISGIKTVSKPGLRRWVKAKDVAKLGGSAGVFILSTSNGIMTGEECREKNVGGEIICRIW